MTLHIPLYGLLIFCVIIALMVFASPQNDYDFFTVPFLMGLAIIAILTILLVHAWGWI